MGDEVEKWVESARRGDRQAFSEIVRLTQQKVFRYCYPMVANRQDAEDMVQETFIRAYRSLGSYEESGRFTGWLLTIAHRTCLNKLKRKGRVHALLQKLANEGTSAIESDHYDESNEEALSLLDSLKPKVRAIVVLKVIHDLSYEEISAIVGIQASSLRKQFERARKQLQKEKEANEKHFKRGVTYEYESTMGKTN